MRRRAVRAERWATVVPGIQRSIRANAGRADAGCQPRGGPHVHRSARKLETRTVPMKKLPIYAATAALGRALEPAAFGPSGSPGARVCPPGVTDPAYCPDIGPPAGTGTTTTTATAPSQVL